MGYLLNSLTFSTEAVGTNMEYVFLIAFAILMFAFSIAMIVLGILMLVNQSNINSGIKKAKAGERFSQFVPFCGDFQAMGAYLHDYLTRSGYFYQNYGADETAYRCGNGF